MKFIKPKNFKKPKSKKRTQQPFKAWGKKRKTIIWRGAYGRDYNLINMDNTHIDNCIGYLENVIRSGSHIWIQRYPRRKLIDYFVTELQYRESHGKY